VIPETVARLREISPVYQKVAADSRRRAQIKRKFSPFRIQVSLSADSRQITIQLHCFHDDMVGLY
jgi:hypothetical protein